MARRTVIPVFGPDSVIDCDAMEEADNDGSSMITCRVKELAAALDGETAFVPGWKGYRFAWGITVNGDVVRAWWRPDEPHTRGDLALIAAACGYRCERLKSRVRLHKVGHPVALVNRMTRQVKEETTQNPDRGMVITWSEFDQMPTSIREEKLSEIIAPTYNPPFEIIVGGLRFGENPPAGRLTPDDVDRLLRPIRTRYATKARDHALILLMARSGLGPTSITRLTMSDLAVEPLPHAFAGRRGERDAVVVGRTWLDTVAAASMRRWIHERDKDFAREGWLFCTISRGEATGYGKGGRLKPGRPLNVSQVREMIRDAGRDVGLDNLTPTDIAEAQLPDRYLRKGPTRALEADLIDSIVKRLPLGSTPLPQELSWLRITVPRVDGERVRANLLRVLTELADAGVAESLVPPASDVAERVEQWIASKLLYRHSDVEHPVRTQVLFGDRCRVDAYNLLTEADVEERRIVELVEALQNRPSVLVQLLLTDASGAIAATAFELD